MKKVFGIGSCMVGIVLVISGAVMKLKGQTAVTVIGGADIRNYQWLIPDDSLRRMSKETVSVN